MTRKTDQPLDADLAGWEQALAIEVGTSYLCRTCGNVVMVTRGGVGVMELVCCGVPMERITPRPAGTETAR
jgi:desulfoferrodoxin-like iron-binding protein